MAFSKTGLFLRSVRFYGVPLITVSFGAALTAMIVTGALIIGDSVRHTLEDLSKARSGLVRTAVVSQERWFRAEAVRLMRTGPETADAAVIILPAYVSLPDLGRGVAVNLYGVDDDFFRLAPASGGAAGYAIDDASVLMNAEASRMLGAGVGTDFVLRVMEPTPMPHDAPLSKSDDAMLARRLEVTGILDGSGFGDFQLAATQQSAPAVFLSRERLARLLGRPGRANVLLSSAGDSVMERFKEVLNLSDYGLQIGRVGAEWELSSKRVFIAQNVDAAVRKLGAGERRILTYFANEIRFGDKSVPYSFVTGADVLPGADGFPAGGGVIINRWLADQLGCPVGAKLELTSYRIDGVRMLSEESFSVTVGAVAEMDDPCVDSSLMPGFPGFEGTQSCSDWDPDLPIDLGRVRPEDEDYWNRYRGAPKIILPLKLAQDFWKNRFGQLTAIRFDGKMSADELSAALLLNLDPAGLGFRALDLKLQNSLGVKQAVDFSGLFIGLSFFIIFAALILTVMLYAFHIERLHKEYGVLRVLGFGDWTIRAMYFGQGLISSVIGALSGSAAGYLYAWAVLLKLNTVWGGAVNQAHIGLFVSSESLAAGAGLSFLAAFFAVCVQTLRFARATGSELVSGAINLKPVSKDRHLVLGLLCLAGSAAVLVYTSAGGRSSDIGLFILVGFLLLGALTELAAVFMLLRASARRPMTLKTLAVKNCARRFDRTMAVMRLIALAVFLTLAVGLNQRSYNSNPLLRSSGTGGFTHYVETSVPVTVDLNSKEGRGALSLSGLPDGIRFFQLPTVKRSEASCLNLNHVVNPNISGLRPEDFAGRFHFQKTVPGTGAGWEALDYDFGEPDIIPAVADMNVIVWSLGKKLGSDLAVTGSDGKSYRLRFVGGLDNSVFQGRVLVSLKNFYRLYPDCIGTDLVLFETDGGDAAEVSGKIARALERYGLNMEETNGRLNRFNTVQNTYLAVFLALGGIGLILGCGGMTVLIRRNLYERRGEITYLGIAGYTRAAVGTLLFYEYFFIFATAVLCGLAAAAVAVYPAVSMLEWSVIITNALITAVLLVALGAVSIVPAVVGGRNINLALLRE